MLHLIQGTPQRAISFPLNQKKAGLLRPASAQTPADQSSANTFNTPESFGMLTQGSPHSSP
jgi:hypothetical protein